MSDQQHLRRIIRTCGRRWRHWSEDDDCPTCRTCRCNCTCEEADHAPSTN